jgi:hypothetical protein
MPFRADAPVLLAGDPCTLVAARLKVHDKARGNTVVVQMKLRYALAAFILIAVWSMTTVASAVTVEVAKKCNALVAKQFPPREPGNPAAGVVNGTAQSARDYYNKCLAKGGNMDDETSNGVK